VALAFPHLLETSTDEGTDFQPNNLTRSHPRFQALLERYRDDVEGGNEPRPSPPIVP
jgi:hypothetical protein